MTERIDRYSIYKCRKEDCPAVFTSLPARKQHEKVYHPLEDLSHILVPIEGFEDKGERDQRISVLRRGYAKPTEISEQVDVETQNEEEEIQIVLEDVVVPARTTKVEPVEHIEPVEPVESIPEPAPEPETKPEVKPEPEVVRIYERKNIVDEFSDWLDSDD